MLVGGWRGCEWSAYELELGPFFLPKVSTTFTNLKRTKSVMAKLMHIAKLVNDSEKIELTSDVDLNSFGSVDPDQNSEYVLRGIQSELNHLIFNFFFEGS
mgnify:CR=1 FL=1